jgi:hypothetical protein
MSDQQTNPEINWVPLAETPFKLRFGWERPDNDEERPNGTRVFSSNFGWISIYRTAQDYFFISCEGTNKSHGVAFPIGDYTYLGADAQLSAAEIVAQGDLINSQRIQRAIEIAVRLAVLEEQLALRGRETTRGEFVRILPSEVAKLKITRWWENEGEDRAGGRLYDLQVGLLNSQAPPLDGSRRSLSVLMSRDPNVLRQIVPDEPRPSVKDVDINPAVQQGEAPNRYLRSTRGKSLQPQWETVLIDAAAFMFSNETPGQLKQVVEYCQKRITQNIADPKFQPSFETTEDHVRPLWQVFNQIYSGNYQL